MQDPPIYRYAGIYYDPRDSANLKTLQDRQLFLGAAARVVQRFVESLFEVVWNLSTERIRTSGALPRRNSQEFTDYNDKRALPRRNSQEFTDYNDKLFAATAKWAKDFNIEAPWIIDEAYSAVVCGLLYAGKGIDPIEAFGTWRRSTPVLNRKWAFQLPAWDPPAESERAYIARANREWPRLRDEYVAATKAELARSGLERVPARRRRRVNPEFRFEWAALHRCGGKPIEELADQYREDTEVIRISVSRTLKGLGFELPT